MPTDADREGTVTLDELLCVRVGLVYDPDADGDNDMTPGGDTDHDSIVAMCARINALTPPPPKPVTPENVFVYSALVANDQVDSYSTQFTPNALEQVARQIVGMPVMRNHSTYGAGDLPVGRWFGAEVVQRDGVTWVRGLFYTARMGDADAQAMDARINTGIIREVSLSWWQGAMKCSVCGQDMWSGDCPHIPGEVYDGRACVGIMDQIKEVAEASLVWKGGQYGTQIGGPEGRVDAAGEQHATLVQRIARKRSATPAHAGESDVLGSWLTEEPAATVGDWFNAG